MNIKDYEAKILESVKCFYKDNNDILNESYNYYIDALHMDYHVI